MYVSMFMYIFIYVCVYLYACVCASCRGHQLYLCPMPNYTKKAILYANAHFNAFICTSSGLMDLPQLYKVCNYYEHISNYPKILDWVPPALSAGDLNSLCRGWRGAIHFFLFPIRFKWSQSPSWLFSLECYWLV